VQEVDFHVVDGDDDDDDASTAAGARFGDADPASQGSYASVSAGSSVAASPIVSTRTRKRASAGSVQFSDTEQLLIKRVKRLDAELMESKVLPASAIAACIVYVW